ncbi:MAG: methyltransferase domain-containing protein [Dehalococcoidia bacterium]|nr:methyltransferase domain-containing protein [Dehalococcoidia bacterium]
MHPALIAILSLIGAVLFVWLVVFRIVRKFRLAPASRRSVTLLAVILESPVRRRLFSPAKLLDKIGIAAGMSVLELGPGPGFFTIEAARRVGYLESPGKLYCVDIEPAMITRLKEKVSKDTLENIMLMVGNGEHLPFKDGIFDLAYLVTVLGEVPDKDRALQELYRVLRPGGVLSISEYLPDPDYPLRRTTIAWARRAGFEPFQQFGNFFAYVVNFRRGYAQVR